MGIDLYEQAKAALHSEQWDSPSEVRLAIGLRIILDLHRPYWSVPVEIADGPLTITEEGLLGAGDWHEASEFEQITGGRWWCDSCRSDAPCATYSAILGALGLSASTEESRA